MKSPVQSHNATIKGLQLIANSSVASFKTRESETSVDLMKYITRCILYIFANSDTVVTVVTVATVNAATLLMKHHTIQQPQSTPYNVH